MTNEEREALIAQGWTPPKVVDPDMVEAELFYDGFNHHLKNDIDLVFGAIKRGRALAAAEAKPGMNWVKHDGSGKRPVGIHQPVLIRNIHGIYGEGFASGIKWHLVTHYCEITPPEDK